MARRSGSGPPKRERPALAGTGALENNNSSTAANKSKRTGAQAARLVSDPRFRHKVQHLERFDSSRLVAELLAQLCIDYGCRRDVERFLDKIIENEAAIRQFGFDQWPPLPLRQVPPR